MISNKLSRRGFFGALGGAVVGAMVAAGVRRVAPLVASVPEEVARATITVVNPAYLAAPYEIAFVTSDPTWARPILWDRKVAPPADMRHYAFPPRLDAAGQYVPPTIEIHPA